MPLGCYVVHCHIIEHEDNEMMRPYKVCPAAGTCDLTCGGALPMP